jgi:uncharacterized membrane protein YraQ (UPF0718 family)
LSATGGGSQDGPGAAPEPAAKPLPRRRTIDGGFLFIAVLGSSAAVATWFLHGPDTFVTAFESNLGLLVETMPKFLAAVLLACWLRLMLPREVIQRHLGAESGWRGLFIATGAGIVVPGGPMTAFPLSVAFLAGGADRGTVVAFVTGWLMLSLQRAIVWEMAFLDPEIVGIRYLVSLPVPLVMGWLARRATGMFDVLGEERQR